mgnify:CR=1 FL=1
MPLPENPVQIAKKTQVFEGLKYYLCGNYYQRDGVRLHRKVWERNKGSIPYGFHIHHKNGDRGDNRIENLEIKEASNHIKEHWKEDYEERYHGAKRNMDIARKFASAWHRSEAGRNHHRDRYYRDNLKEALNKKVDMTCEYCGSDFIGIEHKTKFCSNNCKSNQRRKLGVDNVQKICCICGTQYESSKYFKSNTCRRSCRGELRRQRRRILSGSS